MALQNTRMLHIKSGFDKEGLVTFPSIGELLTILALSCCVNPLAQEWKAIQSKEIGETLKLSVGATLEGGKEFLVYSCSPAQVPVFCLLKEPILCMWAPHASVC